MLLATSQTNRHYISYKMKNSYLIFVVFAFCQLSIKATLGEGKEKYEVETELFKSLFENYNSEISPSPVAVKFGTALITTKINEAESTLDSNIWLRMVWSDPRLKWDDTKFPVGVLRIQSSNVWIPDIQLYNSADGRSGDISTSCLKTNVLIYPNGEVLWVPPCQFKSLCETTLKQFPDKEQICKLKFGSWTYDGFKLDLSLYNDKNFMDMSDFWDTTDWNVLSAAGEVTKKFYPCCEEPYVDISYNVTLKRKPAHSDTSSIENTV